MSCFHYVICSFITNPYGRVHAVSVTIIHEAILLRSDLTIRLVSVINHQSIAGLARLEHEKRGGAYGQ